MAGGDGETEAGNHGDVGQLPFNLAKIHCRVTNFEPVTPLKHLKANCYGQLLADIFLESTLDD